VTNKELELKLGAIGNGNKQAFEELYNDMKIPIYAIIYRITWDKSLSEDIMQEAFFNIYLTFSTPKPLPHNPRAYIFQIARNLAINSTKKPRTDLSLDDISEAVYHPLDDIPQRLDIDTALKTLSFDERQIILLHVIGGFKHREIAEMLGIPSGTVGWKYQKALSKTKKYLSERGTST
jgi:RNA polymerase sigma-70 factor (ECF subfamily)